MKSSYFDYYGGRKDLTNELFTNHSSGIWVGGGPCWAEVWQTLDGGQWGRCLYVSETSPSAVSDQTYHRSREEVTHPLASRYFMAWAQITFLFDILECVPFAFQNTSALLMVQYCFPISIWRLISIKKFPESWKAANCKLHGKIWTKNQNKNFVILVAPFTPLGFPMR